MPPFLPRKRPTPPSSPRTVSAKRARLTDALDAEATNDIPSLKRIKTFSVGSDSSSDSSLSDVDSDQFEDVTVQIKRAEVIREPDKEDEDEEEEEEDEEDDIEWEDAAPNEHVGESSLHTPMANGPIQITLRKDDEDVIDYGTSAKAGSGKKGPSKREKQVRTMTHRLHVQFLLWHNAVRNNWIGDKKVQDILVKQLPPQIVNEVTKWRRSSGLEAPESSKDKPVKGKKRRKMKEGSDRNQRDWGKPSQRLEVGKPDMSYGDPILPLMKVLSAYWRKRFAITAPGLRKRGYGTKHALKQEITSLRLDEHDPERHGERIRDLDEFRKIAQKAEGSRDVGAQLFTALLRGLGIEARLVASLQPSGYGWTKVEQMLPRRPAKLSVADDTEDESTTKTKLATGSAKKRSATSVLSRRRTSKIINLDTDIEEEESTDNDIGSADLKDDESIVDVTPSLPLARRAKYDRDLAFPVYWTEIVSPITNYVTPVSPLVLETSVASTPEALLQFEPRGAKAEKGRQVMAYVVAYSPDGTAKDVTVRYLRKHVWPGKTKGFRLPVEKVPVYDERGKIKRYEDHDWFRHILDPYARTGTKRTHVDDVEESTDLVPQQPEKKNEEEGVDTLQSLKSSADFVLERFLRREEALVPNAVAVRTFASGKGDKYKEESVYRRADVERCLSAESWHKEGRRPKLGEAPMKMVPVRAVTLTRKREAEEHERQYGEKQMQGLYSWDQTEWIIPPPIKDGIIPKNAYGNMDCFVPSMVPKGAVHIPLKGTLRICKRLDIDFAEAVTGFEFGNKRAVPVCTGVVVAEENERLVKDAWIEWNKEQRRKEETKMEKLVLDLWRKFVLGLRIRERVQDMYGDEADTVDAALTGSTREAAIAIDDEDDQRSGGFSREGDYTEDMGGGFLLPHEDEATPVEALIIDGYQAQSQPEASEKTFVQDSTTTFVSAKEEGSPYKDREDAASMDSGSSLQKVDNEDEKRGIWDDDDQPTTEAESSSEIVQSQQRSKKMSEKGANKAKYRTQNDDDIVNSGFGTDGFTDTDIPESESNEEDSQDSDEDEQEMYTPRPTRTRTAKSRSIAAVNSSASVLDTITTKAKSTSKTEAKTRPVAQTRKSNAENKVRGSAGERATAAASSRRGRGRPRKTDYSKSDANTSNPSARRSKRQRASTTSPYFEQ